LFQQPRAKPINPTHPGAAGQLQETQQAARTLGLALDVLNATTGPEIERAFEVIASRHADAVAVAVDARPADLPVQRPTTYELVLDLRTAKSLGLALPAMVMGHADEVIE
jgi:ABC-type uncharacterized transport system substrate-binding protein